MKPKVSVVIPTLDEENYLPLCIDSLKKQTFKEFEIVISDGGSEDGTLEIAGKKADMVLRGTGNIAMARQVGGKRSRGKIIAYTDADAILPEDWLERIVEQLEENGAVYGISEIVPSAKVDLLLNFGVRLAVRLFSMFGVYMPAGSNLAIRRDVFEEIGGFNTELVTNEDVDLVSRAARVSRVKYDPEMRVAVSNRRIAKWGRPKAAFFHLSNFFSYHLFRKAKKSYEEVR